MPSPTSSGPTEPTLGDAADHRIMVAARRQLFTLGYSALTMDELAHELGMSKKTLYRHFPGKDAIVGQIIDDIGGQLRRELDAVLQDPASSFARKLRAVVDVVSPRLALTTPALLRELQRYAPKLHRKIDELRQKNVPYVFGRLFRLGLEEGAVRPGTDPDFAAQFWLHAVRGLLHPDALAVTRLTPQETIPMALELFTGGLLTPAGRKDYEKLFSA